MLREQFSFLVIEELLESETVRVQDTKVHINIIWNLIVLAKWLWVSLEPLTVDIDLDLGVYFSESLVITQRNRNR